MPLPKPPKKGASKKSKTAWRKATMDELTHGPVNAPSRKATHGKQRQKQNIAIMLSEERRGAKKSPKKRK